MGSKDLSSTKSPGSFYVRSATREENPQGCKASASTGDLFSHVSYLLSSKPAT